MWSAALNKPGSVITQGMGGGGGGLQQANEQLNFEWSRQKLLAGKEKGNSQIFNEDFYLPLYLPLWYCPFKLPFLEGGLEEDPDQPNTVPYPDSGDLNEQNELSQSCRNTQIWNRKNFDSTTLPFRKTIGLGSQKT